MNVVVLLNKKSGARATGPNEAPAVAAAFAAAGIDAEVREAPHDRLDDEARAAATSGVDAVVAGGGDGTINTVASALAGGETPLGVLPLGTLNHFAKDLGIPLDLAQAVAVIAQGHVARVDVGRVNDHIFLNNSSLGVYARALVDRDIKRERLGLGKWPAMAWASLKIFRRSPMVRVRLTAPGEMRILKTPLVFLGNNQYRLDKLRVGQRDRLDEGLLSLYVATTHTRWGMFKILVRGLVGRLRQSRDFETLAVEHVTVDSRRNKLPVALDGEIIRLSPPLEYSSWPGALRVFAPKPPEQLLLNPEP